MRRDIFPVRWTGRQAVVALPEHIDVSNAGQIREELLSVINRGAAALIADMTATISCDHAGADAVVRAYQRAVISGTELRLVVTARIVSRMFSLSGLDRLVSIYPSLEAAAAARTPATVRALVARPTETAADGQAPRRRAGRERAQLPAAELPAGKPGSNEAVITPAVVRELLDALRDGVALADGDGAVVLASRRLEEMFGYQHAELLGRPVESLFPAGLQAVQRSDLAACAQKPAARSAGSGARRVGLRKDGTTFPAEISLSPVTTGTGHLALTVIRDTEARPLDDLASAAGTAEQVHCRRELPDKVITSLFHVGLSLQAAMDLPAEVARERIAEALGHLDNTIREIRDTAFTTRDHDTRPAPLNGAG